MRKVTRVPWYVRDEQLHMNLKLFTLLQFMKFLSKRFFDYLERHRSPLIRVAAKYIPSRISQILVTPNDPITLRQESSRETSTIVKTPVGVSGTVQT